MGGGLASCFSLWGFPCQLQVISVSVATGWAVLPAAAQGEDASQEGSSALALGRVQGLAQGPPCTPASPGDIVQGQHFEQGPPLGPLCIPASPGGRVQAQGFGQGPPLGSLCTPASVGDTVQVQALEQVLAQGPPCFPASPGDRVQARGFGQEQAQGPPRAPASPEDTLQVQERQQGLAQESPCTPASAGGQLQGRQQVLALAALCMLTSLGSMQQVQAVILEGNLLVACFAAAAAALGVGTQVSQLLVLLPCLVPLMVLAMALFLLDTAPLRLQTLL